MLRIAIGIGSVIRRSVKPVTGLLWRNWFAGWTTLNNTWNSYK